MGSMNVMFDRINDTFQAKIYIILPVVKNNQAIIFLTLNIYF